MRGESNTGLLIGGVLLLVLLAGGLFVAGVFDGEAPVDPGLDQERRTASGEEEPETSSSEEGGSSNLGGRLETTEFTGRAAAGDVGVASASESATGLVATGTVVDDGGRPIPNAEVALIRDVSPVKNSIMEGDEVASVKTGRTGGFSFEDIPKNGNFVLRARHPDYTTQHAAPVSPERPATLRKKIVLREGMALSGRVSDGDSIPLEEALVRVYDINVKSMNPLGALERQGRTAEDGSFAIEHLKPGLKKVIVSKEGWSTDGRNAFNLAEGENTELVFVLRSGHAITGTIVDARTKLPIAGARVHARPVSFINLSAMAEMEARNARGLPDAAGDGSSFRPREGQDQGGKVPPPVRAVRGAVGEKAFLVAETTSDEQGRYRLDGLLEARYMISVQAEGYQPETGKPANAGDTGVSFQLMPSAQFAGLVIDARTGEPITEFEIAVSPQDQPIFIPQQMKKSFEDPEGRFVYKDVRPGTQHVIAMAPGYAPTTSPPYQVANEQVIEGIVLRLDRGATVSGRVIDADGRPVGGATATLVQDRPGQQNNPFMRIIQQQMNSNSSFKVRSDETGRFEIAGVATGEWKVTLEHPEFMQEETQPFSTGARGETDLGTFRLSQGGTIEGVVMREDGKPDSQATVMVQNADPQQAFASRSIPTGSDGTFSVKGIVPGVYKVRVAQREGKFDIAQLLSPTGVREIVVKDGETIHLEL